MERLSRGNRVSKAMKTFHVKKISRKKEKKERYINVF